MTNNNRGWCLDCVHNGSIHDETGVCHVAHCPCRGYIDATTQPGSNVEAWRNVVRLCEHKDFSRKTVLRIAHTALENLEE